jgi:hypothetical protein
LIKSSGKKGLRRMSLSQSNCVSLRATTVKSLDKPLFTEEYSPGGYTPPAGAAYLYAVTTEDRSEQAIGLKAAATATNFFELREPDGTAFETDIPGHEYIQTRDASQVSNFLNELHCKHVIIDMTGLTHTTWVPLVKIALDLGLEVSVVYFEPIKYTLNPSPRPGEFYDLSERTGGIGPLPLMVNITEVDEHSVIYVALLGFEGQRSKFMYEQVGLDARRIYPVIGLPGFKIEYPFEAFLGNGQLLTETRAYQDAQFAKSNCPFSLFYRLEEIRERHSSDLMRIGLTGTKPHALGAVLFAVREGHTVELVYDHVKRKAKRTAGAERCVVYRVSAFMSQ